MSGPRPGSFCDWLASFEPGESRYVERTSKQPIPARDRRPDPIKDWLFDAAAFMAVPQSTIADDPVRLWRIRRIA